MSDRRLATDTVFGTLDGDLQNDIDAYHHYLTQADTPSFSLHTLSTLARTILARLVLKGEADSEEASRWLGNATFATNYEFELCDQPKGEKRIEVLLPSPQMTLHLPTTGVTEHITPSHWLEAFYLACIWWEPSFISQILSGIDEQEFNQSPACEPNYRQLQVEAAYALFIGDPENMMDRVTDALRAVVNVMKNDEFAELIVYPECLLMDCIATGNMDKFNRELLKAIDSHITYYSRTESRRNDVKAWFCLPALGLSALAQRYQMPVTVTSPYLPLALISKA